MNQVHLQLCSSDEWAEAIQRWIIPWVLEELDLGDDVLEVGPGPGRTTEVLATMVPRLTAAEVDPGLAEALSSRLATSGVDVSHADATDLPYQSDRFSAVLAFTMLHHLPSQQAQDQLFSEAARVLRPGGVFAGTDSLDSAEFRELHVDDVCVPLVPAGLSARLEHAGFESVQVVTNDYGIRFRGRSATAGRT